MTDTLAILGGTPVRDTLLPYSRPLLDEADIKAVNEVLSSDWLTTGPKVSEFEKAFSAFVGARDAVAVSNGTAALHAAMYALDIKKGDEVIVPTMTFAATANAVVFQGGTPVFVDSDSETLLIDPASVEKAITKNTKAIIAVDYAGQPADYAALRTIADKHNLKIVADACHAVGATSDGKQVGTLADLNTFSFHAVKPVATGEGGMITTDDETFAKRMRQFRNHGLTSDHRERHNAGAWFYEMENLGYNYRLTDIQCALGLSQLKKVPSWTKHRQSIAIKYDVAFAKLQEVEPLKIRKGATHAYHLYIAQFDLKATRNEVFDALRAENMGVNVHYIPVHLHPYYQKNFGTKKGMFPNAEAVFEKMISLPLFAGMSEEDSDDVIKAVQKVVTHYSK